MSGTKYWQTLRLGHAATLALMAAAVVATPSVLSAQSSSSSPFSGLFGRGDPLKDSPVKLTFDMKGGDADLKQQLQNTSLMTGSLQERRYTGQDILAAARADYARLLGTLYDNGYYSSTIDITLDGVEAATIAPLDAPQTIRNVVVTVTPGPLFHYSRAQIAPVAPGTDLPSGYKTGKIARTSTIKSAATAGVNGWRDYGHAKAAVQDSNIIADHANDVIDSRIALAPGPTVSFGQMTMRGYDRLRPQRLRKIAGFPTGQRYDPEKLEQVRKRLRRTGVFSSITLEEADRLNADNSMDVALTVIEQKPRRLGAGVELSTQDGAAISGYWMHRNLAGGGERLRFDGSVSDIGSGTSGRDIKLSTRLERPATFNPDITAYVTARGERLLEEDYDQDIAVIGAGVQWLPNDRVTGNAGFELQKSRVKDDDENVTDFKLVALPIDLTWDRRDEPTNAKRGYWLYGSLTPFYGIEDTGSGVRTLAEGRYYRSFGTDDRITLAGRARAGSIFGPSIEETPRDYLFFSGGGGSVRGQSYQSLGVEVIPGLDGPVKTGGMSIVNTTAEVRYQLREKIGVAAFADAGQVWTDSGWSGNSGWQAGAGVGLRYNTPIGPLRFDVAHPVGGGATGDGVQVYLGLGQAF
ncbi:MAG: outer membrane protein assembly factor [Paracoccus denitrificans]|nr:MAG: outer membrane protein assembly factor [Paracoccus denitrificans]PZO85819.1 MAG: outer membrane protein assembly factor [Paracoccus denitrificans]